MEVDSNGNDIILHNAFIAMFHDHIIAIDTGSYHAFIDKDTRIINGGNGIAIPGFVDSDFAPLPLRTPRLFVRQVNYEEYYKQHEAELLRDMNSLLFQMLRNGITTFAYPSLEQMYEEKLHSLKKYWIEYYHSDYDKQALSCHYHPDEYPCLDPIYQARQYVRQGLPAMEVLKRMTCVPASILRAPHIGTLQVGQQADIILLDGCNIEYVFHQLSQHCIRSVIKKGNQQYPYVII